MPKSAQIESLAEMRDVLRGAGVAPEQIAQVLQGMLHRERHRTRQASSWWKGSPYGGDLIFADPMDRYADQQTLRGLMGEIVWETDAAGKLDLDFLPEGKRARVAGIVRDYSEVRRLSRVAGLRVASDQSRDELLRVELQRDLREALSGEEYFEFTLRDTESREWTRLRIDAARFDLTEREFRDTARLLLAARQITDEAARMEAVERIHDELRAQLGPDRVFTARVKNSPEYVQLREAQIRFGFSQAALDRVIETWKQTYEAAEALRADSQSGAEDGRASWRRLATETRSQLLATLGAEAGEAYLAQSMVWLRDWDSGEDTRMGGGLMSKR